MGFFSSKASDSDVLQGLDLMVEIAQDARATGQTQRENAAHEEMNKGIDEAERRGLGR